MANMCTQVHYRLVYSSNCCQQFWLLSRLALVSSLKLIAIVTIAKLTQNNSTALLLFLTKTDGYMVEYPTQVAFSTYIRLSCDHGWIPGDQLKCDNQSTNQSNQSNVLCLFICFLYISIALRPNSNHDFGSVKYLNGDCNITKEYLFRPL